MLIHRFPRVHLLVLLLAATAIAPSATSAEEPARAPAKRIAAVLQPFVDEHALAGAVTLVADKDRVLSLEAVGFADITANKPMKPDALFWIASQSKSITAAALLMLVDEGKVKLDDPVEKYLPEFRGQWLAVERDKEHLLLKRPKHPITVRNILSHTSGLPFSSAMEQPTLDLLPLREGALSYVMTPLLFEPGSKYQYSNAGINTAGRIIEVVSEMPYEDFLDKRLFGPLGMKDTTFWPNEQQLARLAKSYKPNVAKDGLEETTITQLKYPLSDRRRQPMPAGGLFSTAEDVARFCQMLLNGGTFKGERYLSEAAVKEMTTKQTGEAVKEQYGLGLSTGGGTFGHGGAYATNMTVDPKRGLVMVYLVQHAGFPKNGGQSGGVFRKAAVERYGEAATERKGAGAAMKRKPSFMIGRQTTYLTGPLDEDGYIDYPTALNQRLSKGVTPDNNANVLIWKALGPRPEGRKMPPEYFKWLGIDEPAKRGDYFVPMSRYVKDTLNINAPEASQAIFKEMDQCAERPWTAEQHPKIADWLKANEKPIARMIEATKRSHYFSPLVPMKSEKGPSGLISALLPAVQKCREVANALRARAMLRLGEGRPDDAWRDLLACHRLGRLVGCGGSLIEGLVGIAIDAIAGRGDLVFLEASKAESPRILECLRDLQKLPPMPPMADKVNLAERFMFLECIALVERGGIKHLDMLSGGGGSSGFPDSLSRTISDSIDWDPALRMGNQWTDRMVAAMATENPLIRRKRLDKMEKELKALRVKTTKMVQNPLNLLSGKARSDMIGSIMVTLLMPAIAKVQAAGDRCEQLQNNLYVAFALAAYRRDRGSYPRELASLAPRYLAKVPRDNFTGKPLIYISDNKGYLFYSVGVNGRDEEGRGRDDDVPGDDLGVRMPLPESRK